MISFNEVPANARVPGCYIEIDNSLANNATELQKVLIVTAHTIGSPTPANTLKMAQTKEEAAQFFGANDAVAVLEYYRKHDQSLPTYILTVDDIDVGLATLGDTQFHNIICTMNDETSVRKLIEFLDARYSALEQIPGIAYIAKKGGYADLVTYASQFNCPMLSIFGVNQLANSDNGELTEAAILGSLVSQIAPSLATDPCRPLQNLKLVGVYSTAVSEFNWTERNLLLHEGVSTYKVSATGEVFIERIITSYTENANAVADDSYLDVMTIATAIFFREAQRSRILSKFPRHKLAEDGTNFAPGQVILTPAIFKSELIALYSELEYRGIVQDMSGYKKSLIAEIDPTNKSRINYQDSPQFVNGLIITAGKIQFRK